MTIKGKRTKIVTEFFDLYFRGVMKNKLIIGIFFDLLGNLKHDVGIDESL